MNCDCVTCPGFDPDDAGGSLSEKSFDPDSSNLLASEKSFDPDSGGLLGSEGGNGAEDDSEKSFDASEESFDPDGMGGEDAMSSASFDPDAQAVKNERSLDPDAMEDAGDQDLSGFEQAAGANAPTISMAIASAAMKNMASEANTGLQTLKLQVCKPTITREHTF